MQRTKQHLVMLITPTRPGLRSQANGALASSHWRSNSGVSPVNSLTSLTVNTVCRAPAADQACLDA